MVLVADDDETILDLMRDFLEAEGFHVLQYYKVRMKYKQKFSQEK